MVVGVQLGPNAAAEGIGTTEILRRDTVSHFVAQADAEPHGVRAAEHRRVVLKLLAILCLAGMADLSAAAIERSQHLNRGAHVVGNV